MQKISQTSIKVRELFPNLKYAVNEGYLFFILEGASDEELGKYAYDENSDVSRILASIRNNVSLLDLREVELKNIILTNEKILTSPDASDIPWVEVF